MNQPLVKICMKCFILSFMHQYKPSTFLHFPPFSFPLPIPFSFALLHLWFPAPSVMAAAEEVPEPLKYQTVALKVSIHCEGCKREVQRALQHIEGVYKVSIDLQQHKVVITGNVPAETLVKKLIKTGKHAELWPEPPKPIENPSGACNGKKKRNKKKKNKNKSNDGKPNEPSADPESNESSDNDDDDDGSSNEASGKPEIPKSSDIIEEKQNVAEKTVSNGGNRKKGKKKNRSRNNNNNNNGSEVGVVAEEAVKKAAFDSPLCNTSQLPSYVVSYRSVQPSMSHAGAFYPWQAPQSSYVYSTASEGSYFIFSEDNANACFVM